MALKSSGAQAASSDYLIDVWTSDDDLPDSSVTAISQTSEGYLWIGTHNGLARFDGVRFVNFDPLNTPELKHARVHGLFVDERGTLWINTHDGSMTSWRKGVFALEWQGGQVSQVFSGSNEVLFAHLSGGLISGNQNGNGPVDWKSIPLAGRTTGGSFRKDGDGALWYVMRDGGIGRLVGTNSDSLSNDIGLNGQRANCLSVDRDGRVWVGTDKGIAKWNGTRFEDQTPTNGEPVLNVTFLYCTPDGSCWVFSNGRVRKSSGRRWAAEVDSWKELSEVNFTAYMGAYSDQKGGVWFRHYGLGLFHVTRDGDVRRLTSAEGLPGNRISSWFEDREGNFWVGVDRGGLVRLREKKFLTIGAAEGLVNTAISTICQDDQRDVWIGTFGGGLNRWRDGKLKRFELSEGTDKASFFSAYPDPLGRLWVSAGREDLFVMENERISSPPVSVHGIKSMLLDSKGRLWMGRQNGFDCLVNGALTNYPSEINFFRMDIRALAEDRDGRIWMGTGDGTLIAFSEGRFKTYRAGDASAGQAIWSLLPDEDGSLWIGTFRGGLLRFKNGKFTRYTTESGLTSDIISQILDDGLGRLWFGSHKGIFNVRKSFFEALDSGMIKSLPCISYGLYDGLPTLECTGNYQPSCWRGTDGRLWFATSKGVVSVRPEEMTANPVPPPVVIEEILVDGKTYVRSPGGNSRIPGSKKQEPRPHLQIPPGKHQFEFHYTALSFAAPDKVRFRYRLQSVDDSWVEVGAKRVAHFEPLPPGDYVFQVTACNNDGVWNDTGATLAFIMLPQYWQTWWFKLLAGTAVGGSIFGAIRFAVTARLRKNLEGLRQQRAIERERERIAKDIHDDLGAGLTQIMLQSALAKRSSQGEVQANLGHISDTARDLVRTMDEIVWAINPENDNLDGLVTYVSKLTQEYVTLAGLRCRLDMPTQLPAFVLTAEVRHNLFLAIKEVLNNAVKHANATEISLQLKLLPAGFTFVIKDNGQGFAQGGTDLKSTEANRISSGHGLRNLTQRLDEIGGKCTVISVPGQGTTVELTVMLQPKK